MKIKRPKSSSPIPKHAKKVFSGVIFDVYQWKQKLFDGSFTTFEKLKRPDTVNVIPITRNKKIILCKQTQPNRKPFYGFFGGRIDKGESPLHAARRELFEETGYQSKKYLLLNSTQLTDKIDWASFTFIAKDCEKISKQHLEAGEKIKLIFVSFDELLDFMYRNNFRDREIESYIFKKLREPKKLKKLKNLLFS